MNGAARQDSRKPDTPTLVAISALAYVLAVALHEHGGHAVACVLMGSHPKELGAFYVDCDDAALSDLGRRVVALAGPVASLLTGVVAFAGLRRITAVASPRYYFAWLLGGIGLMSAAGYPLFSGISGLGDLGTAHDGAFEGVPAPIVWRIGLVAAGFIAYKAVVGYLCRTIAPCAGEADGAPAAVVRRATLVSYCTGALVYLAIGALNPMGWTIILLSVLPSSMGGTSALLWMWPLYRRWIKTPAQGAGLGLTRSWSWIGLAAVVVIVYAVVFGPTWRP